LVHLELIVVTLFILEKYSPPLNPDTTSKIPLKSLRVLVPMIILNKMIYGFVKPRIRIILNQKMDQFSWLTSKFCFIFNKPKKRDIDNTFAMYIYKLN